MNPPDSSPNFPQPSNPQPGNLPPPPPPLYQSGGVVQPGYQTGAVFQNVPGQMGTSKMAIASLVASLLALCTAFVGAGFLGIVGVILGHIALSQIHKSNGFQTGRGLAIAGLILGYLEVAGFVVIVLLALVAASQSK